MPILEALQTYPLLWLGTALVLGLCVGSFLNVVIWRLPRMMEQSWRRECTQLLEDGAATTEPAPEFNLATPASHCPHCQAAIRPWQNIPLVSYLVLGGKCHHCKAPISARYPVIEAVAGALAVLVAVHWGVSWQALAMMGFAWALLALTMIDVDHQLLPDQITLPLLWAGLIANQFGLFTTLSGAVWGAVAGYLALWSVYHLFKLVTGKEGMGYGDFKLLAALGAWLGWQALPLIIILSSLVGAVVGVVQLSLQGRDRSTPIPFGPYLAAAGLIAALWGEFLINAYFQFAGLGR